VLSVGAWRGVWAVRCGSGGGAPVLRALRGARWGCPSCGEPVIAGYRFCHACGHLLAGSAAPVTVLPGDVAAAGPVAERRVCSVLFCDVVGFTPLSEARDPEAVRERLSFNDKHEPGRTAQ
jgi:predicted RNA-binding Zn-ribbon protein involved in translation (DUF1610 family)